MCHSSENRKHTTLHTKKDNSVQTIPAAKGDNLGNTGITMAAEQRMHFLVQISEFTNT